MITHTCESPPQCEQDQDGDSYGIGPSCLGPDCDDNNPNIHTSITCSWDGSSCGTHSLCLFTCPALPQEICDNSIDDDCDSIIDCLDIDCSTFPACQSQVHYIWLEAESGQTTSPMQIGQDVNASNSSYVFTPENTPETTNPQPEAIIDFDIPESGDYMLWARLFGPATDNDAVYIGFNGNFDRVYPTSWGIYEWAGVETTHRSGNYVHYLNAGQNQINMGHGEGGARVDMLLVTNNLTYVPTGLGLTFHRCDTNPQDGCVQLNELLGFMDDWYYDSTAYPMWEMMEGVSLWKSGAGCSS